MANDGLKPYVVVLFADVCGSTLLYDQLGDETATGLVMRALELVGSIVREQRGNVIGTIGDELLCTFKDEEAALGAALQIHDRIRQDAEMQQHHLSFRIGINAGRVVESGASIYGDTINVAARLAGEAKANQSLLSESVAAGASGQIRRLIRPLGEVSVRGKSGMLTVFELLVPDTEMEITEVARPKIPEMRSFLLRLKHQSRETRLNPLLVRHLLGRGVECDLIVKHTTISREHAEIRYNNGRFMLTDMSTNGTHVVSGAQAQLAHRTSVELRGRGTIYLGRTLNDRHFAIDFDTFGSETQRREATGQV